MFFDIDGTLMEDSSSHYMPESTPLALQKARRAGHLLYVNTGRPLCNVDEDVRCLGFDGYICGCGTYIECDGKELFYYPNPKTLCMEMVQLIRETGCSPLFEHRDAFFFDPQARELPFITMLRQTFRMQEKNIWRSTDDPDFRFDSRIWTRSGRESHRTLHSLTGERALRSLSRRHVPKRRAWILSCNITIWTRRMPMLSGTA